MIHLDYRDARPIYSQIVDNIRSQMTAGILEPGDKLPSVRELASELAINPNTIQRAYRELEADGWIASVSGKGSFVCDLANGAGESNQQLWTQFDKAAQELLEAGVPLQTLLMHLKQGGDQDA